MVQCAVGLVELRWLVTFFGSFKELVEIGSVLVEPHLIAAALQRRSNQS